LHFFLLSVFVVFAISVVLIVKVMARGVVAKAFVTACALVVVTVRVLEIDAALENYCEFF